MQDKYNLIANKLIPLAKYWSLRLGFLDVINDTSCFIPLIEDRKDIGDDLKVMIRISKEWKNKKEINVGEAGFLFRLLQFASWKYNLEKIFIKERTLKERKICDNPEIINWPIKRLLELDNKTTQWASASILTGNEENIENNFFLDLTKEAVSHYNKARKEGNSCEVRYDDTLLLHANAFIELLTKGNTDFRARQPDDYCFARAFNLISKKEGEENWPELKGHESNRLEEMENQMNNLENGEEIDSKDHRVVQAIAMLSLFQNKKAEFTYPQAVNKSWPQFWNFLDYVRMRKKLGS